MKKHLQIFARLTLLALLLVCSFGSEVSATTKATALVPTGNGFLHVTSGIEDSAARAVNLGTSDVTGVAPVANRAAPTFAETKSALGLASSTVDFNGQQVTTSGAPTGPSSLVNKTYADSIASQGSQGYVSRPTVDYVATSSLTLSGAQTVDGVAILSGVNVRVLVTANGTSNGVWITQSSSWIRAPDMPAGNSAAGTYVVVTRGNTLASTEWLCTSAPGLDLVGTNSLTFAQQKRGALGWRQAAYFDFSTISATSYSTDTTYTILGYTWTKYNSAKEATAVAANGTGLIWKPGSSTTIISGGNRLIPMLAVPLASLLATMTNPPDLENVTGVRVRAYWDSATTPNAAYDLSYFGLCFGTPTSSSNAMFFGTRGFGPAATGISNKVTANTVDVIATARNTGYATGSEVLSLVIDGSLALTNSQGIYYAAHAGSGPAIPPSSSSYTVGALNNIYGNSTQGTFFDLQVPNNAVIFIGAGRNNNSTGTWNPTLIALSVDIRS